MFRSLEFQDAKQMFKNEGFLHDGQNMQHILEILLMHALHAVLVASSAQCTVLFCLAKLHPVT